MNGIVRISYLFILCMQSMKSNPDEKIMLTLLLSSIVIEAQLFDLDYQKKTLRNISARLL
jgi:hypothetical protein